MRALIFALLLAGCQSPTKIQKHQLVTLDRFENGDLACYVYGKKADGKPFNSMADFELCNREGEFRGRLVKLTFTKGRINDCEGADPCGKTREVELINSIQIAE